MSGLQGDPENEPSRVPLIRTIQRAIREKRRRWARRGFWDSDEQAAAVIALIVTVVVLLFVIWWTNRLRIGE